MGSSMFKKTIFFILFVSSVIPLTSRANAKYF